MAEGARINNHAGLIWSIADLLRGDYKPPSTEGHPAAGPAPPPRLRARADQGSRCSRGPRALTVENVDPCSTGSPASVLQHLAPRLPHRCWPTRPTSLATCAPTSPASTVDTRDVIEKFDFDAQIARLDHANLLYLVVSKFAEIDLHPDAVSNLEMGYLFEELIRRFSEHSNETAGEHFTPREVIRLMVDLLFIEDDDAAAHARHRAHPLDPACGTGGMLSVAEEYLRELNPDAQLEVFGQELNDESYAICRSDMMLKGAGRIEHRLRQQLHRGRPRRQDVRLHARQSALRRGVEEGRARSIRRTSTRSSASTVASAPGLPRINDGSLPLPPAHDLEDEAPRGGRQPAAIVFNGSPLFTGDAGSGESEIRRWIIENDWLEAIVALPDQLFYNTGISTYFWVVTNRKRPERRGKVQLIDAASRSAEDAQEPGQQAQ